MRLFTFQCRLEILDCPVVEGEATSMGSASLVADGTVVDGLEHFLQRLSHGLTDAELDEHLLVFFTGDRRECDRLAQRGRHHCSDLGTRERLSEGYR